MGTLILAGAGLAHMTVMDRLQDYRAAGHRVLVVGPSEHHYYSGMGPGLLGGTYEPEEVRFRVRRMVERRGGEFVQDLVTAVDAPRRVVRLASGRELAYDVLSCNVGSTVSGGPAGNPLPAAGQGVYPVKPVENLLAARDRIRSLGAEAGKQALGILVVGNGPAALEVAGNVHLLGRELPASPEITVLAGRSFLSGLPPKARALCLRSLVRRGVAVDESGYATRIEPGLVRLENGQTRRGDLILWAVGIRPPRLFADSNLPVGPDNGLLVDRFLRCVGHPEIFGGGDCIHFQDAPLDKVGAFAARQNPVLCHNLLAALDGREPRPFDPGGGYLLIFNLGDGSGVLVRRGVLGDGLVFGGGLFFGGRLAFYIKDVMDRRFMRRFRS